MFLFPLFCLFLPLHKRANSLDAPLYHLLRSGPLRRFLYSNTRPVVVSRMALAKYLGFGLRKRGEQRLEDLPGRSRLPAVILALILHASLQMVERLK